MQGNEGCDGLAGVEPHDHAESEGDSAIPARPSTSGNSSGSSPPGRHAGAGVGARYAARAAARASSSAGRRAWRSPGPRRRARAERRSADSYSLGRWPTSHRLRQRARYRGALVWPAVGSLTLRLSPMSGHQCDTFRFEINPIQINALTATSPTRSSDKVSRVFFQIHGRRKAAYIPPPRNGPTEGQRNTRCAICPAPHRYP
jgi:hypothetical protein